MRLKKRIITIFTTENKVIFKCVIKSKKQTMYQSGLIKKIEFLDIKKCNHLK